MEKYLMLILILVGVSFGQSDNSLFTTDTTSLIYTQRQARAVIGDSANVLRSLLGDSSSLMLKKSLNLSDVASVVTSRINLGVYSTGAVDTYLDAKTDTTTFKSHRDSTDKHVAHSGVTITAGDGLSGGGTIAESRTFTINMNYNKGIETSNDSIGINLDGATLTLSSSGLKVTDNTYVSEADSNDIDVGHYVTPNWLENNYGNLTNKLQVEVEDSNDADVGHYVTPTHLLANHYTETETDGLVGAKADTARTITAGDGLSGGGSFGENRTLAVNLDYDGGLETSDDSINVKIDGTTLTKTSSGLKVSDATLAEKVAYGDSGTYFMTPQNVQDFYTAVVPEIQEMISDSSHFWFDGSTLYGKGLYNLGSIANPFNLGYFDSLYAAHFAGTTGTFGNLSITDDLTVADTLFGKVASITGDVVAGEDLVATDQVVMKQGTANSPSMIFAGDTTTGFWYGGAIHRLAFSAEGVTKFNLISDYWNMGATVMLRWNQTALGGFNDVGLSRLGTGKLALGAGAASADVTLGEYDGTLCLGNIGIKSTTFGTSADGVLGIAIGTAPTSSPADMCQIYVADSAGTAGNASLYVRNELGNVTLLSPHASTAPDWFYDNDDEVRFSYNPYYGTEGRVVFTNVDRDMRLSQLQRLGKPLPTDTLKLITYYEETIPEYNARTGLKLKVENWQANQDSIYVQREREIAKWNFEKADYDKKLKEYNETDTETKIADNIQPPEKFTKEKPKKYTKKDKPERLK